MTPDWLTAALSETGVLQQGRVAAASWERVGQQYGFTGLVVRIELLYEDEEVNPPASLVAKLPLALGLTVPGYRARQEQEPAFMRRHYERCAREERFYREVGAAFAPRPYCTAADDHDRRVVLLLEDLSGGRQGDVPHGCSVDEAALVIDELAPFHALRSLVAELPLGEVEREGRRRHGFRGDESQEPHPAQASRVERFARR